MKQGKGLIPFRACREIAHSVSEASDRLDKIFINYWTKDLAGSSRRAFSVSAYANLAQRSCRIFLLSANSVWHRETACFMVCLQAQSWCPWLVDGSSDTLKAASLGSVSVTNLKNRFMALLAYLHKFKKQNKIAFHYTLSSLVTHHVAASFLF